MVWLIKKKYPIWVLFLCHFFNNNTSIPKISLKTLDKKSVTLYNIVNNKFKEGITNDKV